MSEKINPSVLKVYGIKDEKELENFSCLGVDEQIAFLKKLNKNMPKESIWQKNFSLWKFIVILNVLGFILVLVIKNLQ